MKTILGLVSLVLVGCGSAKDLTDLLKEAKSPAPSSAPVAEVTVAPAAAVEAPAPVNSQRTVAVQNDQLEQKAYAIANIKQLPACDDTSEGALVYIKNMDKFVTCENGKWNELAVKNGKDGANGLDGSNGKSIGVAVEKITNSLEVVCPTGGTNYHFFYDNDNNGEYGSGDEFFAETPICNGDSGKDGKDGKDGEQGLKGDKGEQGIQGQQGTQGIQGANGLDGIGRIAYSMTCSGTFGTQEGANIRDSKLIYGGAIEMEYTETQSGDKIFNARITFIDIGNEYVKNKVFAANSPSNNIYHPGSGIRHILIMDKIRSISDNGRFDFYVSHTENASAYVEIEDPGLNNNPMTMNCPNGVCTYRKMVSGNLNCTGATY